MIEKKVLIKFDNKNLIIGIGLVLLGVIVPLFFNVGNFNIYELLFESLNNDDKGLLLLAAFRLVLLNSIRGLPHYLGAFIIAESTDLTFKGRRVPQFKGLFALIIIPIVYFTINTAHNIKYDLGVPAFIVIFAIMYLEKMDFSKINLSKKTLIIVLLLFGVQWLDVVPVLSLLSFGRGETSQDVKTIAQLMDSTYIISIFAIMLSFIFTFSAFLVTKLINDEHKILVTTEKNKRVERELHEARIKALEARNYIELKNLVHDLKTPLTSSQALVSVLMMKDDNSNSQNSLYLKKLEQSIDKLNDMISEILYEDRKAFIETEDLMNYILSHVSHLPVASMITYENHAKGSYVEVNKIRFSRAIINILDNSFNAVSKEDGKIHIVISNDYQNIYFELRDNGIGIKPDLMENIGVRGFSIRESTGLGLSFVNDVIKSHDGKMELESEYGVGTSIKITLNRVKEDEHENIDNR